jgi:hypothetical protein
VLKYQAGDGVKLRKTASFGWRALFLAFDSIKEYFERTYISLRTAVNKPIHKK